VPRAAAISYVGPRSRWAMFCETEEACHDETVNEPGSRSIAGGNCDIGNASARSWRPFPRAAKVHRQVEASRVRSRPTTDARALRDRTQQTGPVREWSNSSHLFTTTKVLRVRADGRAAGPPCGGWFGRRLPVISRSTGCSAVSYAPRICRGLCGPSSYRACRRMEHV
jgi:hypothetical protein